MGCVLSKKRIILSFQSPSSGFNILIGCASVLKTHSSRLIKSGSLNMRKKYFNVSAIQKLCLDNS